MLISRNKYPVVHVYKHFQDLKNRQPCPFCCHNDAVVIPYFPDYVTCTYCGRTVSDSAYRTFINFHFSTEGWL